MRRIARHIHSNAVGYVALFAALTVAPAWAVTQVGPKQILDDAVRSHHIKDGEVQSQDVAEQSLTGADVANGSIRGQDVGDGSLAGQDLIETAIGKREIGPAAIGTNETATQPAAQGQGSREIPSAQPHTAIQLDSEAFDTADMHVSGSSLIHAPVTGYFLALGSVLWETYPTDASSRTIGVQRCTSNSSCAEADVFAAAIDRAQPNELMNQTASGVIHLAAGQSVRLVADQNAGEPVTATGTLNLIWLAP